MKSKAEPLSGGRPFSHRKMSLVDTKLNQTHNNIVQTHFKASRRPSGGRKS